MLHHLLHPIKVLWTGRVTLFWPIWIALTAIGILVALWIVPRRSERERRQFSTQRLRCWSPADILAVAVLGLSLVGYVAGVLVWEDFTYYDNSHFTNGTLAGHNIPLQISPEGGRFWPLGHQEFNLLRHLTHSITGYHALRIVQLLLVCAILLFFDEELTVRCRVSLVFLLLVTPSVLISFTGLIYPEANMILLLACVAWFVQQYERTQQLTWAVAAVACAQLLLYYKETAFLMLLGFAAGRLFMRCRNDASWDFARLRDSESRLDLCFAILAGMFVVFYLVAMFPKYGAGYADSRRLPLLQIVGMYAELDLLAGVFICVWLTRMFLVARGRLVPSLMWDGLACGGALYFAGYIVLRMESAYYLAPVDLIAILYVGRLVFLSLKRMSRVARWCTFALLALVILQDLSVSGFRMYERKNVVHAKAEMARVIQARYRSDPQSAKRLFFPYGKPFFILEFASYLNYIGVPVEQFQGKSTVGGVALIGREVHSNGPCGYRAFICHPGAGPEPGDLVVVFPDDPATMATSASDQPTGSIQLLSYDPLPPIPPWGEPFVNLLHVASPVFSLTRIPDSWLKASVTVSK